MRATGLALAVTLVLALLGPVIPAGAHAILLRAEPGIGQTVSSAPNTVTLWFSEGIEVDRDAVQVVDRDGARFDLENARVSREDVQQVQVNVKQLPQGVYTVRWRITSIDTHVISGTYQFGVGAAVTGGATQTLSGTNSPVEAVLRWFSLAAISVLVGGFWFHQLVLRRFQELPATLLSAPIDMLRAMRIAALALLLLNLLWMAYQILLVTDGGLGALLNPEAISKVVMRSRFGTIWLGRMVCVIALLGVVDQLEMHARNGNAKASRWWWAGLPIGAGLALTATLLGHAAAEEFVWLSVTVDWLHLTATAVWLGGLAHLLLTAGGAATRAQTGQRLAALAALWPNFSRLAILSVQILVATGIISAWLILGRVEFLSSTDYGRTLLVKLALVAPLLAIGAVNLLRYGPWLEAAGRTPSGETALLRKTTLSLRSEAVFGFAILALAGLLGATAPPYDADPAALAGAGPALGASVPPAGVTLAQGAASSLVVLNVAPGSVGPNNVRINLRDATGADIVGAAVQVRVSAPGGSGASLVTLEPAENAYRGIVQLAEAAQWSVEVRATIPGKAEESAEFNVRVPLPTAKERLLQAKEAMNKLTALKERQVLRGAGGQAVAYDYRYAAPGSMSATGNDGSDVVLIGRTRYTRTGGPWSKVDVPSELAYKFPEYDFTLGVDRVAELGQETVDGIPATVLAFEQTGTGFYYRIWLDSDNLVRRIKMMGPSHFMDATLTDFNVPIDITAPIT